MRLQLSAEDQAFREEMREFFTTQVPQDIRDAVIPAAHGRSMLFSNMAAERAPAPAPIIAMTGTELQGA